MIARIVRRLVEKILKQVKAGKIKIQSDENDFIYFNDDEISFQDQDSFLKISQKGIHLGDGDDSITLSSDGAIKVKSNKKTTLHIDDCGIHISGGKDFCRFSKSGVNVMSGKNWSSLGSLSKLSKMRFKSGKNTININGDRIHIKDNNGFCDISSDGINITGGKNSIHIQSSKKDWD